MAYFYYFITFSTSLVFILLSLVFRFMIVCNLSLLGLHFILFHSFSSLIHAHKHLSNTVTRLVVFYV